MKTRRGRAGKVRTCIFENGPAIDPINALAGRLRCQPDGHRHAEALLEVYSDWIMAYSPKPFLRLVR